MNKMAKLLPFLALLAVMLWPQLGYAQSYACGGGALCVGYPSTPTVNLGTIGGAATAANQSSQLTQETATATGVGTPADTAWTGTGSGSVIAILKSLLTPFGSALSAASLPVVIASDQVAVAVKQATAANLNATAVIAAGAAIIGKVGIDQTTPGTTNGVQVLPGSTTAVTQATASNLNATVTVSGQAVSNHDCGGSITTGGTAQQIITTGQNVHGFLLQVGVNDSNTDPIYFSDTTTTPGAGVAGSLSLNPSTSTAAGGSFSTPLNYPTGTAIYANGATTGDKFKCRYW